MQFAQLEVEGEIYTPVVDDNGGFLQPDEVARLSTEPAKSRATRRVKAILFTENRLRDGSPGLNLRQGFFCTPILGGGGLPVTVADNVVGEVERIANLTAGLEWYGPIAADGTRGELVVVSPKTGEVIATMKNPPPCADDFEIVATIRLLDNSRLAELVFDAIKRGVLDSVCATFDEYVRDEQGRSIGGVVKSIAIGGGQGNCLPGARILDAWVS